MRPLPPRCSSLHHLRIVVPGASYEVELPASGAEFT
jgi:hypothetical protein